MTAYNPAIVALNNMLREQIRLVEQFVDINQRMYQSYSTGLNSNFRYTTLEDTQQVSGKHACKIKFARDLSRVAMRIAVISPETPFARYMDEKNEILEM